MINKNFTKYFQIPLYWLTLLVFFFLVSSLIPMLTGYFVSMLTSGTDKHEVFRIFGPNFPRLMSFLSSLAFSIALSLFLWSKILRPIGSISLAAKQVADGDFSVHVPNSKSLQAICELTDNFNRMVQELNSIESLRNDFGPRFPMSSRHRSPPSRAMRHCCRIHLSQRRTGMNTRASSSTARASSPQ